MKLRRICTLLCVLTLILGTVPAAAAGYADLPESHWAYEDMDKTAKLHLLLGMGDGRMDPDGALTWAQALTLVTRTFAPEAYNDPANAGEDWKLQAYQASHAARIMLPPGEEFIYMTPEYLDLPIARQDMVVLLDRAIPAAIKDTRWEYVPDETDPWGGSYREVTADEMLVDLWQVPVSHIPSVRRMYSLEVINGRVYTDELGKDTYWFHGSDLLRRCDVAAMLNRSLEKVDASRYGEEKAVTVHVVDESGAALLPVFTAETRVGASVLSLAGEEAAKTWDLHYYINDDISMPVSTACGDYTVVYRPMNDMEREQQDFWDAVERGEASWEDEWQLSYHRYEMGENAYKHNLLFGDVEKRRYADRAEAESGQVTVTVPFWTIRRGQKVATSGSFTINAAIAEDVVALFTEIFNDPEQFPMHSIGGYGWRGDSATGEHNCGTAIDISPTENYQVRDGRAMVGSHWTPGEDPYSIPEDGSVVRIFEKYGWSWGGNAWCGHADPTVDYHDYMHFSYMGG